MCHNIRQWGESSLTHDSFICIYCMISLSYNLSVISFSIYIDSWHNRYHSRKITHLKLIMFLVQLAKGNQVKSVDITLNAHVQTKTALVHEFILICVLPDSNTGINYWAKGRTDSFYYLIYFSFRLQWNFCNVLL